MNAFGFSSRYGKLRSYVQTYSVAPAPATATAMDSAPTAAASESAPAATASTP